MISCAPSVGFYYVTVSGAFVGTGENVGGSLLLQFAAPPAMIAATPAAAAPATSDLDAASALLGLIGTSAACPPQTATASAPAEAAPAVHTTALQKSRPTTPPR